MGRRLIGAALAACGALALLAAPGASAASLAGSNCAADAAYTQQSMVSLHSPIGSPIPSTIPTAGVITHWSFRVGVSYSYQVAATLKVAEASGAGQFKIVGESAPSSVAFGVTESPTRIPVRSGDLIGDSVLASNGVASEQGVMFCETSETADEVAVLPGDPTTGSTVAPIKTLSERQIPVTVTVEPDADGDGYGDETQDECPTDAATQGPCPAANPTGGGSNPTGGGSGSGSTPPATGSAAPASPAAPLSLSASGSAQRGFAVVTLTASGQATVTVAGTANLGKGKSVPLGGGTQTVLPGSLAKFTVRFPAQLQQRLKQLPPSRSLALNLTATAPGAGATTLTVKVKGLKKIRPRR